MATLETRILIHPQDEGPGGPPLSKKNTTMIIAFLCKCKKTKNRVWFLWGPFLASRKLIGTNL